MKWVFVLGVVLCLASGFSASAQQLPAPQLIEVREVKVKLERIASFERNVKKFIEAHNLGNSGEYWLAAQRVHGEMGVYTFYFLSRNSWGALDHKVNEMELLRKAFGKREAQALMESFLSPLESARTCFQMSRPDLSLNDEPKHFLQATTMLVTYVRVRPGLGLDFEKLVAQVNQAHLKLDTKTHASWSSAVTGGCSDYIQSIYVENFSGFDKIFMGNAVRDAFGEQAYLDFAKTMAAVVESAEFTVSRFRPDLSRPSSAFVKANSNFWQNKPHFHARLK